MFQASDKDQVAAEDSNRTNFDLNLGLKAAEGDRETKSRNAEQDEVGDQPDKVSSGKNMEMKFATNSEPPNKLKRKAVAADLKTRVWPISLALFSLFFYKNFWCNEQEAYAAPSLVHN